MNDTPAVPPPKPPRALASMAAGVSLLMSVAAAAYGLSHGDARLVIGSFFGVAFAVVLVVVLNHVAKVLLEAGAELDAAPRAEKLSRARFWEWVIRLFVVFTILVFMLVLALLVRPVVQLLTIGLGSKSVCAPMCDTRFACLGTPVDACVVNCERYLPAAKVFPLCSEAVTNDLRCFESLTCPEWSENTTGQMNGRNDYPCADAELRLYLYCSGGADAQSCIMNCQAQTQCDATAPDVDSCARTCLVGLKALLVQHGQECWNASVALNICTATFSCDTRRQFAQKGSVGPCTSQKSEYLRLCGIRDN